MESATMLYRNETWLRDQYLGDVKSVQQMADDIAVPAQTIWYWMQKFDIPRRSRTEAGVLCNGDPENKFHDEEWLRDAYHDKTVAQIANDCGVAKSSVLASLRRYKIPTRTTCSIASSNAVSLYRDKEWMFDQYVTQQKSSEQIAEELGMGSSAIAGWLETLGILKREKAERHHLARANHVELTDEAVQFIEGQLLGDGCLHSRSVFSAQYQHGSKYLAYCEWVSATLSGYGIQQSGNIHKTLVLGKYDSYHYCSLAYAELRALRERFYPKVKKIIPADLEITPLVLREWYVGDGSLAYPKSGRPSIKLATCSFTKEDVARVADKLRDIGLSVVHHSNKYERLSVSANSVGMFLEYIGPPPEGIPMYHYKWGRQNEG